MTHIRNYRFAKRKTFVHARIEYVNYINQLLTDHFVQSGSTIHTEYGSRNDNFVIIPTFVIGIRIFVMVDMVNTRSPMGVIANTVTVTTVTFVVAVQSTPETNNLGYWIELNILGSFCYGI